MLGIAGAYVLRAVAESGSFPKLVVVALALAYAATWMVWASRVPVGAPFASTAYAATSALILVPMLAELTLRFQVLSGERDRRIAGRVRDRSIRSGLET